MGEQQGCQHFLIRRHNRWRTPSRLNVELNFFMDHLLQFKKLSWDSEQLGIPCGMIDCTSCSFDQSEVVERIEELLNKNCDVQFITIKLSSCYSDLINRLIREQADLIDVELVFKFSCASPVNVKTVSSIQFMQTLDPDPLLPLAEEMRWSRLQIDKRFPRDKVVSMWKESIRNYCQGRADEIAVAYREDTPAGMITVNFIAKDSVNLFMVGVLPEFQKQGVGTELVQAVTLRYGGLRDIYVETSIQNEAAIRLYQKAGFRLGYTRYILHKLQ